MESHGPYLHQFFSAMHNIEKRQCLGITLESVSVIVQLMNMGEINVTVHVLSHITITRFYSQFYFTTTIVTKSKVQSHSSFGNNIRMAINSWNQYSTGHL